MMRMKACLANLPNLSISRDHPEESLADLLFDF